MCDDEDKDLEEHCEEMNELPTELEERGVNVNEMYGRFSMFWLVTHIDESIQPNGDKIDKVDHTNYQQMKVLSGTVGMALNSLGEEDEELADFMGIASFIRAAVLAQGWMPKFEAPHFTGTIETPFHVANYIADLLGTKDVERFVRPYDVRIILQLSCEEIWKKTPKLAMVALDIYKEYSVVQAIGATLEQHGHKISFPALRRETETYIREHWKREPKSTANAWRKFKANLKKKMIPKELVQ
jgi:hypothetical protein